MNRLLLLVVVPLIAYPFFASSPLAASDHRGWCIGVGNPHRSSSCSSTTPVIHQGVATQTPTVNQVPQPQILVPTPSQIRVVPKRPPENRQVQPVPTLIVSPIVKPPSQSTVTNPQLPQIMPPSLRPPIAVAQPIPTAKPNPTTQLGPEPIVVPPMPQGPQAVPTGTPNPQQPPVVLTPVIAPTLSTQAPAQLPVGVPNPQTPSQLPQPVIAPPLPQGPQLVPTGTPNPQQPPDVLTPVIAPTLSAQTPSRVPVAVPNPQTPAQLPHPIVAPPMPQGPQLVPTGTPNPQQPPALLGPILKPQLVIQSEPQIPVPVPNPTQLQSPQPILAPPMPQQPLQGPAVTIAPQGPAVMKPLEAPSFATRTTPQPPVLGPATTSTPPIPGGTLLPPPLQQPPGSTTNLPVGTNIPIVIQPLDRPTFTTVTGPQRPNIANGETTTVIVPTNGPNTQVMLPQVIRRPRQYDRPRQEAILPPTGNTIEGQTSALLPPNLVAEGLGRHPAHQLPVFDLPDGRRQCLVSGFGRRYVVAPDGQRKVSGMSPVLRGFGPIMRDVPAFSHRTAGCILLVKRRED